MRSKISAEYSYLRCDWVKSLKTSPMARIVKIILIIWVAVLTDIAYSCCGGTLKFRWIDISGKNLDNSGKYAVETNSETINKKSYGIRVEFNEELLANNHNAGILSSAMATSCHDEYIYTDTIRYLKILTNANFDASHLRNTDISDLFLGIIPFQGNDLPKHINQVINDINKNNNQQDLRVDLFLLYEPKLDSIYSFSIEIGLNNNRVLKTVTDTIILK
jgi:hypothetical protein